MELIAVARLLLFATPLWVVLAFVAYWVQNRSVTFNSLMTFATLEAFSLVLGCLAAGNTSLAALLVSWTVLLALACIPLRLLQFYLEGRQFTIRGVLLLTAVIAVMLAILRVLRTHLPNIDW